MDTIHVDEHLRTSHPDAFAAGDVAHAYHPLLRRRLRVEHWDTAIEQGITAARNMLGAGEPYERLPYFFTDQYDLGVEYVGSVGPDGYDEVVLRGNVPARRFTAFWRTAACSRGCTSTTGTPSTRSAAWWRRRWWMSHGFATPSLPLEALTD